MSKKTLLVILVRSASASAACACEQPMHKRRAMLMTGGGGNSNRMHSIDEGMSGQQCNYASDEQWQWEAYAKQMEMIDGDAPGAASGWPRRARATGTAGQPLPPCSSSPLPDASGLWFFLVDHCAGCRWDLAFLGPNSAASTVLTRRAGQWATVKTEVCESWSSWTARWARANCLLATNRQWLKRLSWSCG